MKILASALVLFLLAVCASGQASSAQPDVTVLQNKWRIDLYNPALDKDPLAASKEHQQEEIQQQAAARANENRFVTESRPCRRSCASPHLIQEIAGSRHSTFMN